MTLLFNPSGTPQNKSAQDTNLFGFFSRQYWVRQGSANLVSKGKTVNTQALSARPLQPLTGLHRMGAAGQGRGEWARLCTSETVYAQVGDQLQCANLQVRLVPKVYVSLSLTPHFYRPPRGCCF